MAERRMFAKTIIDSDAFLDMPMSAQCLYFHMSMRADDDGFVNNPRKIQRMVGASEDDLKILLAKRFVIAFDSGVVVIKHWWIHNYIQKDRYKPTHYDEERAALQKKKDGSYTLQGNGPAAALPGGDEDEEPAPDTECIQDVSETDTQVRLGKVRLGKVRLGKGPFAAFAEEEKDQELAEALSDWMLSLHEEGRPLTDREQSAVVAKLKGEINKRYWVQAVRKSTVGGWRSVYMRGEYKKKAEEESRKKQWAEVPAQEETERLERLTKKMEGGADA